ncbi:MAG: DUF177 domain-containing protein [Flavobacteriaceae bacterium]|nr:DUF177 domain-containing protein [Flavobacteriaceae bacterium]
MKKLNEFLIPFIGLKLGKHQFEYQINKAFFDSFDYDEFESADIKVSVFFIKKSNILELNLKHKGTIYVPCDLTNEMFYFPIKGNLKVIVQFGEEYNDDNDELLILPHGEHEINISQIIYEMIALSIPFRKVHPGVKDGTLDSEALRKLNELRVDELKKDRNKKTEDNIDPRWDKLKQLLTDK